MQRLIIAFLCVILAVPVLTVGAQDDGGTGNLIAYGDTVTGEITNRDFEQIYTFEGEAGDVASIIMARTDTSSDLDPYLYLTTLDNEILGQSDDDYFSLDSLVVVKLPADGTYQIVAARRDGRGGSGTGGYTLTLNKDRQMQLGMAAEGTVVNDYQQGDFQIFIPDTTGTYVVRYQQVRGDFYPSLGVVRLANDEYDYSETVADFGALHLKALQVTMDFEAGRIYLLTLSYNYYDYNTSENATALYTLKIDAAE